jgi:hypothetical protein
MNRRQKNYTETNRKSYVKRTKKHTQKKTHAPVIVEQTKKDTKRQIEKLCTKYKETYEKKDTH